MELLSKLYPWNFESSEFDRSITPSRLSQGYEVLNLSRYRVFFTPLPSRAAHYYAFPALPNYNFNHIKTNVGPLTW